MVFDRRAFPICIAATLLALSGPRYVEATGWSATFGTAADNERVEAIYPTADGAYLMASEDGRHLTKVSAAGEVIWSRIMQGVTRLSPAGSGFVTFVHNNNTLIYLNGLGEVVWWRAFDRPIYPTLARASPDGTLLIGARVENRPFIAKLTSNGEVVWQMSVTLPGMTVGYLLDFLPLDDNGGFLALMSGWPGEPPTSSDFIARFSGSGNVVWSRELVAVAGSDHGATGVTKLGKVAGGGYFAYGLSGLIVFNSAGYPTSYRTGLPFGDTGIWPTVDGGYMIAGFDGFYEWATVQKLDRQLNSEWRRNFGSGATSKLFSIAPTPAGGWILGGTITPSGKSDSDGWVFRLDSGGQPFGSCPDSVSSSAPDLSNGIRQCEVQITHSSDAPDDVPVAAVTRCNLPSAPPGFSPVQQDFDFTCGPGAQPNAVRCTVTTRNNYRGTFDISLSYGSSGNVYVGANESASISLAFPFDTLAGTYFVTTTSGISGSIIASSLAAVSTQPAPALTSVPVPISWLPYSLSRNLLCSGETEVCPLASALDGKAELDSDGDSLSDCIEKNGVRDPNSRQMLVDLPALGANPYHKDVFVEIDYLKGLDHDHKPLPEAIRLAEQAMAALPVQNPDGKPGVNLHVDYGQRDWKDSESNDFSVFDDSLLTWSLVDILKNMTVPPGRVGFSPYRRGIFHYCVYGHETSREDGEGVLGAARWARHWAGADFMVTWGELKRDKNREAATFLHELGHNLGLRHGGGDGVNNKPNYRSVMNYLYSPNLQFSTAALPPPPPNPPHLDESHLDEGEGIGAAGFTVYYCPPPRICPNPDFTGHGNLCIANDGRAIDWNCNGTIDAVDVGVNINGDYSDEPVPQPIMGDLLGFMDTTPIVNFDGIRQATSGLIVGSEPESGSEPEPREITAEEYLAIPDPVHQLVEAVSTVVQLAWGETRPVAFRVSNIGIQDDTYDLFGYSTAGYALGGAPGPLTPAPIALDGGEAALVEIAVTAPPAGVPGVSNLVLIVTGRRRPELADEVAVQIVVGSQVPALFSDGFESGDTGAWSGKSPL